MVFSEISECTVLWVCFEGAKASRPHVIASFRAWALGSRYTSTLPHLVKMGQNPGEPPVNIRFNPTTKIGSKLGGAAKATWDPKTVRTTAIVAMQELTAQLGLLQSTLQRHSWSGESPQHDPRAAGERHLEQRVQRGSAFSATWFSCSFVSWTPKVVNPKFSSKSWPCHWVGGG